MLFASIFRQAMYVHLGKTEYIRGSRRHMRPTADHLIIIKEAKDLLLHLLHIQLYSIEIFRIFSYYLHHTHADERYGLCS